MPLLSSAELTSMRSTTAGTLPDTCLIERSTLSQNAIGEVVQTWATVDAGVACRLAPATQGQLADLGAQAMLVADWILTLAQGADIDEGDRVTIDSRPFRVVALNNAFDWQLCTRAALAVIEPAVE